MDWKKYIPLYIFTFIWTLLLILGAIPQTQIHGTESVGATLTMVGGYCGIVLGCNMSSWKSFKVKHGKSEISATQEIPIKKDIKKDIIKSEGRGND